eukprot:COSAG01_NODE_8644_length_2710_cov_2.322482_5_plen_55_part_00
MCGAELDVHSILRYYYAWCDERTAARGRGPRGRPGNSSAVRGAGAAPARHGPGL